MPSAAPGNHKSLTGPVPSPVPLVVVAPLDPLRIIIRPDNACIIKYPPSAPPLIIINQG